MKKLIIITIILLLLTGLNSIETDKLLHFLSGFSITLGTNQFLGLDCGIAIGTASVIGKEIWDKSEGGEMSEGDLCWGMTGVCCAGMVIAISEYEPEKAQTYRREINLDNNLEANYLRIKLFKED